MKRKALRIMAGLIAEKQIAITLANSDHAAADVRVLYDSEENVIKDTYSIYGELSSQVQHSIIKDLIGRSPT